MCKIIIFYILTITTEINSGHVVYSETFHDKTECETKAKEYSKHKYIIDARCTQKSLNTDENN